MLKVFKTANIFQRRRRLALLGVLAVLLVILAQIPASHYRQFWVELGQFFCYDVGLGQFQTDQVSLELLNTLEVKGRAPKTGYKREQFSDGWGKVGA